MEVTDEQLVAYLDGEVSENEKQRLDELIASNPSLQHRLATFRDIDNQITHAHKSIDNIPVPPGITKMLNSKSTDEKTPTNNLVSAQESSWGRVKIFFSRTYWGSAWATFAATACALALGILLGSQLFTYSGTSSRFIAELAGRITSQNPLYQVLEFSPANVVSQIDAGQSAIAMPVLTFRAIDNRYCREFTVSTSQQAARGVACREGEDWRLELMIRDDSVSVSEDQYTTASSTTSAALDNLFNTLASEAPMDAISEARLIESSWKE